MGFFYEIIHNFNNGTIPLSIYELNYIVNKNYIKSKDTIKLSSS